ncbi:MAG: c-type cytochrome [Armatimonadetes bacterium]|nr:c-type cytochrome [Armatimonadota bacterium]
MKSAILRTGAALMLAGAIFLAAGPRAASAVPKVSPEVKAVFKGECKKCHGWDGKGLTPQGKKVGVKDWTAAAYQKKATDEQILKTITEGFKDPKDPKRKMEPYKGKLAKELVLVVRAFAKAPGPFPEEVK